MSLLLFQVFCYSKKSEGRNCARSLPMHVGPRASNGFGSSFVRSWVSKLCSRPCKMIEFPIMPFSVNFWLNNTTLVVVLVSNYIFPTK